MAEPAAAPLLTVTDLAVHYRQGGGVFGGSRPLRAVDGVTFSLKPGECVGLVGESGCGKSTLASAIVGLTTPTRGSIDVGGVAVAGRSQDRMRLARTVQMVFQDPYASLNPRRTIGDMLAGPLRLHGIVNNGEVADRVASTLKRVGLRPEHASRYPYAFSGGQRQRVGIARALIVEPKLLVCDEPVSALDVSIRAQIINLLVELTESLGLATLMISHDLSVVEHMCDRVLVMYLGRIVESGQWQSLFERPRHPYTRALLAAIPDPFKPAAQQRAVAKGDIPNPLDPPTGCAFHPRCPNVIDACRVAPGPILAQTSPHHTVACHRAGSV
jgi:peptide/nickel transport system ATP-binding protein